MKKVAFGCDHAGFVLKKEVLKVVQDLGFEVIDHGCHSPERVDYPDFARLVAQDVQKGKVSSGILICGTGIGMAIAANKFKGVRAASLADVFSAKMARQHNDLNVLCLGGRVMGVGVAQLITETFFKTKFEGGRHQERLEKILAIEK